MPTIRERLANALLGPERERLERVGNALMRAYQEGPFQLTPSQLVEQLKEIDSSILADLVMQLQYEQLGTMGYNPAQTEAERIRAVDESRRQYKYDVLVQWIVHLWTDFGFGENISIIPEDDKAKDVWSDFWKADRNAGILSDDELSFLSEDLLVDGEKFLTFYVSDADGLATIRDIDTKEITELVTAPGDDRNVLFYKRAWNEGSQGLEMYYPDWMALTTDELNKEYADPKTGETKTYAEQVLPKGAKRADEAQEGTIVLMLHVAHNRKGDLRGWPLMTAGIPWSRAHKHFREDRATLASSVAAIVRKKKVKGGSRAIDGIRRTLTSALSPASAYETNPPPAAGSTLLENEDVDTTAMPLSTGAGDAKVDGESLMLMAGLGGGVFPHWMGAGDSYRLATACYSDDTEVLTENGWKKYINWTSGEKIATYNHEYKRLDYVEPTKLHVYDYAGDMISISGRGVDALVTPNHRMLVLNENNCSRKWAKKEFEVVEADKLPSRFALPSYAIVEREGIESFVLPGYSYDTQFGIRVHPNRRILMDDWLRFLGLWIAEGDTYKPKGYNQYQIEISQSSKSPHLEKIRDLIGKMPFGFTESNGHNDVLRWRASDKALYTWLEGNCGKGSNNKCLPDFVFSLDARQSKILLDALWDGDGHWEKSEHYQGFYTSTSRRLIDETQALMVNSGDWGSVAINRPENGHKLFEKSSACWVLHRSTYRKRSLARRNNVSKVPYNGKVWCFEAPPNKMFVTRRNGCLLIAGNTAMETPLLREFTRYQMFWAAQFRKMIRIVLWADEKYGNGSKYETYDAKVSTDKLIENDFAKVSQAISGMATAVLFPSIQAKLLPPETARLFGMEMWKNLLPAMGVKNVDELVNDDTFKVNEPIPVSKPAVPSVTEPAGTGADQGEPGTEPPITATELGSTTQEKIKAALSTISELREAVKSIKEQGNGEEDKAIKMTESQVIRRDPETGEIVGAKAIQYYEHDGKDGGKPRKTKVIETRTVRRDPATHKILGVDTVRKYEDVVEGSK